jgi:hypothetical protein
MTNYLIRRFFQMIIVVLLSTMAIYMILNIAPGGPLDGMRSIGDRRNRPSEADMARLEAYLGIDKPLFMRYLTWLIGDDWLGADWLYIGLGQYRYPKLSATGEQLVLRDPSTGEATPQWNKARFWADPGPALLNPGYPLWVWGEKTGDHQFCRPDPGVCWRRQTRGFSRLARCSRWWADHHYRTQVEFNPRSQWTMKQPIPSRKAACRAGTGSAAENLRSTGSADC